jgi:hypothetical protein
MPSDTLLPDAPASNRREIFAMLCRELPPPVDATPEVRAVRDMGAMDAVEALHPMDAFEARLAVRIVAMDAHAGDGLRLAGLAVDDPPEVRRCRAQAASMARQSNSALRTLLRMQATRDKQLAAMHPAAMERAGYWFREVSVPEPAASRAPADAPQPAEAQSAEARCAEVRRAKAQSGEPWTEPTQAEIDAEAERYAVIYPDRAARIRAAGGLPVRLDFGPPEPAIVAALLRDLGGPERSVRGI